jgi:hypothetical protein
VIVPDNFDKKIKELRALIFRDKKLPEEPGYNEAHDTITDDSISNDCLQITVESILRKAQNEKDY